MVRLVHVKDVSDIGLKFGNFNQYAGMCAGWGEGRLVPAGVGARLKLGFKAEKENP